MNYLPRIAIKGHALANFIAKFTYSDTIEVASTMDNAEVVKGVEMKKVQRLQLDKRTQTNGASI